MQGVALTEKCATKEDSAELLTRSCEIVPIFDRRLLLGYKGDKRIYEIGDFVQKIYRTEIRSAFDYAVEILVLKNKEKGNNPAWFANYCDKLRPTIK